MRQPPSDHNKLVVPSRKINGAYHESERYKNNNKEKSIDSNKRKEVLAVAYLMLGRPQKAAEILDEQ